MLDLATANKSKLNPSAPLRFYIVILAQHFACARVRGSVKRLLRLEL